MQPYGLVYNKKYDNMIKLINTWNSWLSRIIIVISNRLLMVVFIFSVQSKRFCSEETVFACFMVDTPEPALEQVLCRWNHTRETLSTSLQNLRKSNSTPLSSRIQAHLRKVTIITLTYSNEAGCLGFLIWQHYLCTVWSAQLLYVQYIQCWECTDKFFLTE